jgi:hypothetical protein
LKLILTFTFARLQNLIGVGTPAIRNTTGVTKKHHAIPRINPIKKDRIMMTAILSLEQNQIP